MSATELQLQKHWAAAGAAMMVERAVPSDLQAACQPAGHLAQPALSPLLHLLLPSASVAGSCGTLSILRLQCLLQGQLPAMLS